MRLGLDTGKMELSIIEKQYSDIELKLSHMDDDFNFSKMSKMSIKSKIKNSSSNNTKNQLSSQPKSDNNPENLAYQFPRQTRHHDFRNYQYDKFKGRNSRKSSTHNEGSIKHETIT